MGFSLYPFEKKYQDLRKMTELKPKIESVDGK